MLSLILLFLLFRAVLSPWRWHRPRGWYRPHGMFWGGPYMWHRSPMRGPGMWRGWF